MHSLHVQHEMNSQYLYLQISVTNLLNDFHGCWYWACTQKAVMWIPFGFIWVHFRWSPNWKFWNCQNKSYKNLVHDTKYRILSDMLLETSLIWYKFRDIWKNCSLPQYNRVLTTYYINDTVLKYVLYQIKVI